MADEKLLDGEEEPISLEDEGVAPKAGNTSSQGPLGLGFKPALKTFGNVGKVGEHKTQFKRQLNKDGCGAVRCRIFNSKIALASLQHMETQINEWMDENDFEIKHVGHCIGVMEGKTQEPNMIVTVWY